MVHLIKKSYLVLTDSGGLQEEAPSLGKPVLVMRQFTERPESLEAGTAKLVGAETEVIVQSVSELMTEGSAIDAMKTCVNPFGDGFAAGRIALICRQIFKGAPRWANRGLGRQSVLSPTADRTGTVNKVSALP